MADVSFSDSLNRFKESFLWAAAQGGNTEDCESLLEIGAEVDWKNTDGDTALLAACRRGHADTIVLLLVYGASPNARGRDMLTPLHICARNADIKTLNVLLEAGADTSLTSPDNETAFEIAQQKGHDSIVRRLAGDSSADAVSPAPVVNQPQNKGARARAPDITPLSSQGRVRPGSRGNSGAMIREDVIRSAHPDGVEMRSSRGNGQEGLTPPGEDREAAPKSLHPKLLSAAPRSKSSSSSYSLIGKDVDHEFSDDEQYKALCKQLDSENRSKRALEAQVQAMQAQLRELDVSISRLHHQMTETDGKLATQTKELNQLRAVGVDTYTLQECEEIERRLKSTLDLITARKDKIVKDEMGQQKEQRLCVICQIEEKSVVLFPCRHMCLCESCANHEDLDACPLCRRVIIQKVSVFS